MAEKKFEQTFHHTEPLEVYEDFLKQSSNVKIKEKSLTKKTDENLKNNQNFKEVFHHTLPVELYDDLQSQSYEVMTSSKSNGKIPNAVAPPLPVERHRPQALGTAIVPKTYDGKTNPRVWLNHYEIVADANLWLPDMMLKRVIGSLEGAAQCWFMNQRLSSQFDNWNKFRDGLISRFTNTLDDIMLTQNIIQTKQRNNDFDKYWEEKMGLIKLTSPNMNEKELMHHLFTGLNKELKDKVMDKLTIRECETSADLQALIKEIVDIQSYQQEENHNNTNRRVRYHTNAHIKGERVDWEKTNRDNRRYLKLEKEMQNLKELLANKAKVSDEPIDSAENKDQNTENNWREFIRCYNCHEKGHFAKECNAKTQDYESEDGEEINADEVD
jgi:hypothetical protein